MELITEQSSTWMDIATIFLSAADVIATATVGLIVGYLAYSQKRQRDLQVAEKKLAAYQALWGKMKIASPFRLTVWKAEPLTLEERQKLFKDFTRWYYENGNGMYMGDTTRAIYLTAKDNLICPLEFYQPASIAEKLAGLETELQEEKRGYFSIRQLSLLRNSMKADLGVFGIPYHVDLNECDREFLTACEIDIDTKPWSESQPDPARGEQVVEILPMCNKYHMVAPTKGVMVFSSE